MPNLLFWADGCAPAGRRGRPGPADRPYWTTGSNPGSRRRRSRGLGSLDKASAPVTKARRFPAEPRESARATRRLSPLDTRSGSTNRRARRIEYRRRQNVIVKWSCAVDDCGCRRRADGHCRQRGVAVDPTGLPCGARRGSHKCAHCRPSGIAERHLPSNKADRRLMVAGTCLGGRSQITCCASGRRRLDACPCQRQGESPKSRRLTAHANLRKNVLQ